VQRTAAYADISELSCEACARPNTILFAFKMTTLIDTVGQRNSVSNRTPRGRKHWWSERMCARNRIRAISQAPAMRQTSLW